MTKFLRCHVCVIGAGSAGLSVASGAAQLGARTVLFERGEMGGDCLNYGCVPSKALLAAAHAAHDAREARRFGIAAGTPEIDFAAVMAHVRGAIANIAPNDSVERFEGLGVRVIRADARFAGPGEVTGGGYRVRARRIVIAAGSTAAMPPIAGIDDVRVFTNETIFSLTERPGHLLIIGGGPIGVEMSQAFRRLGSRVTLFESERVLSRDEPELVAVLKARLSLDGVEVREGVKVARVAAADGGAINIALGDSGEIISGTHLLIAAGRRPRLEGLDLEKAGVAFTSKGIAVDSRLRTTNRRIYAIGDIAGGPQFTHVSSYHAGIVIRNALFRLRTRVDYSALPWVTYADPELAHAGLTERDARQRYEKDVRVVQAEFEANDRAQTERETAGGIKVVTRADGTILGASIVGRNAGELIHPWVLAIAQKLKLTALTGVIFPYPTRGEISKAAASAFYAPRLFSRWPRRLVRVLSSFG